MQNDQVIKDIKVIGVEKPQKSKLQQHFEYVIRVIYENGYEHLIFRRYSMLFDFHAVMKEVVKDNYNSLIVMPELPVARFQHVSRKFFGLGMNKELKQMTEFCQKIIQLPKFISETDIILKFFGELGTDRAHAEAYQEERQKDLPREQAELPCSPSTNGPEPPFGQSGDVPDVENQFRSVADFEAHGTGELSVTCGEIVTVIEKNTSGWWLVSNTSGSTGFTPATFLQALEEQHESEEEWVDVKGPDRPTCRTGFATGNTWKGDRPKYSASNFYCSILRMNDWVKLFLLVVWAGRQYADMYVAIKNYEAQCPDEISFNLGEELEVISMSNFGWWKVRRGEEVGLSPASSLTMKIGRRSPASSFSEDPMNEFRKSLNNMSKQSSYREREAPPRANSTKSTDDEFAAGHIYTTVEEAGEEQVKPEQNCCSTAEYTEVIPKHLRPKDDSGTTTSYVNVPMIKDGVPHYAHDSNETEAVNVYVVRKCYQGHGLFLREGETVQLIAVMPDCCHWKVATLTEAPFQEGLIPASYLCPELPVEMLEQTSPTWKTSTECHDTLEHREPVKVLPRFTRPPSSSPVMSKKPVPKPRAAGNKSPAVTPKVIQVVALADYTPNSQNEVLVFNKGDVGRLIKKTPQSGWWFIELKGVEGWVPSLYWKDVKDGTDLKSSNIPYTRDKSQWFCGKMQRQECEVLFEKCGQHLSYLVRESIQRVGSYVLSIKFNDKVHHFPIEKSTSGKFNIGRLSFNKLSEIISYYAIYPLFYTDHKQPVSVGEPLQRT